MTELRQRMLDAMVQRGFAARTQDSYVRAIRRMAKHYRRDPALYTPQEVQAYLLHMVQHDKLSYSSMNQAACAAQFLYQTVLGHGREHFQVPFAKVPAKQPELLGREEIARLLAACTYPARRMLLQTVYVSGLRVSHPSWNSAMPNALPRN
jgi:integrase/recombinase XerD